MSMKGLCMNCIKALDHTESSEHTTQGLFTSLVQDYYIQTLMCTFGLWEDK
jgi:hypothetical protein